MRLIDADELIEQIWEKHKKTEEPYDFCVDELKEVFCGIVALVDEQPTAYDPDKVVEQLEDRKSLMLETFKISESDIDRGRIYGMDKAIEIVKGGGVDA